MRDNFSTKTKEILAKRVGYFCSNPQCRKMTSGPNNDPKKATSIGVAAHIFPASPGGPRAQSKINQDLTSDIVNGIWLCNNCSTLIDRDEIKYTESVLRNWKQQAESTAELLISSQIQYYNNRIAIDGVHYDTKLEATWGVFFRLLNWSFQYKPTNISYWNPKFHIITDAGEKYYVDIIGLNNFEAQRRSIGKATNYSSNILLVSDHPFAETKSSDIYPNVIGYTSLEGVLQNGDQEYCTSFVFDLCGQGIGIHNHCKFDFELLEYHSPLKEFCRPIWKQAKFIIQSLPSSEVS